MWVLHSEQYSENRRDRETKFSGMVDSLKELLRIRIQRESHSLESCRSSRKSVDDAVEKLTADLKVSDRFFNCLPKAVVFFLVRPN